jgi:hypothetical protein
MQASWLSFPPPRGGGKVERHGVWQFAAALYSYEKWIIVGDGNHDFYTHDSQHSRLWA